MSVHHILFTRKNWNKGFAHKLRKLFIYELPDDIHSALHASVPPVPRISEPDALVLWTEAKRAPIDNVYDALEWLIFHAPTREFQDAIKEQYDFLDEI